MTEDLDARLRRLQASEDVDALIDLGCDLADAGRQTDAEWCFRRAADMGDTVASFNLGNALAAQQRWEEAVDAYEARAGRRRARRLAQPRQGARGPRRPRRCDARLPRRRRRRRPRGRPAAGLPPARAGRAARGHGRRAWRSRPWATRRPRPSSPAGAGAPPSTRRWSPTSAPGPTSSRRRGPTSPTCCAETGRPDEARFVLEKGAKLGEAVAWLPLGNFYADEMGDDEAAEEAYRGGIAAGEAYCHHNLAVLLAERGDFDGAVEQFRLGAAAGDQLAADALRELEHG